MTREKSNLKEIRRILLRREDFHPFPTYNEREKWDALPEDIRKQYLDRQDELNAFESSAFSAIKYMGYYRTNYSGEYHKWAGERRRALADAVMCECIAHDGKLIDKIVDEVWSLCEESSWVDPDHNNHMHDHMLSGEIKNALPDVLDFNFVDLVAGSTASLLSWTYYLLKEPLDEVTPMVCERIEVEILKRIIWPFMHHDDFTWFGCYGHKINNWNPWISTNILCADLLVVKDEDLRAKVFSRLMEKLDIYINYCNPDGGCDEGPGYWGAAGAALYDCLDLLAAATGEKLNFFGEPLIRNIGEYIAKANLCGNRYANFADNSPKIETNAVMLLRFAEDVGSDFLRSFALSHYERKPFSMNYSFAWRTLLDLFDRDRVEKLAAEEVPVFTPGTFWFPDTEILFTRDKANDLQIAAKAGFNNESHNHNDLGSFMMVWKGKTVFADLGCLPYTARTFSPFRYEIWILQSAWHSCATVNGFDQHGGDEYKANVLSYAETDDTVEFSMELKGAYEPEAGIVSYVRAFSFDKAKAELTVKDVFDLESPDGVAEAHYVTVVRPEITGDSAAVAVGEDTCRVSWTGAEKAEILTHDMENEDKKKSWGSDDAYKLSLTAAGTGTRRELTVRIRMEA